MHSWLAGGVTLLLAVGTMVSGVGIAGFAPTAASAAELTKANLRIEKNVIVKSVVYGPNDPVPTVEVGEEFLWQIKVICDQIADQCVNATMTDLIPAEFEITGDPNVAGAHSSTIDGQTVTVKFEEALTQPAGAVGLISGGDLTIPVKLRAIDQGNDGKIYSNTAKVEADNATEVSDPAEVKASINLTLLAEASKSFADERLLAAPGTAVAMTFGGTNASNGPVNQLVVQDPADPAAAPNIFSQYLAVDSIGDTTWPTGAERAVVSVTIDGGVTWTSADAVTAGGQLQLPAGIDAASVQGLRVAFQADNPVIPANASTSVQLALVQRAGVADLTSLVTLSNVSSAVTTVGDETSPEATAEDQLVILPAGTSVVASKSFSPQEIASVSDLAGAATSSTVTLGAENSGTLPLKSLVISEPSNPADRSATNLLSSAHKDASTNGLGSVVFDGFTSASVWPNGAEKATVTYHFDDGSAPLTVVSTVADTLPALPAGDTRRVSGFKIEYTGAAIVAGAQAKAPFVVNAVPSQVALLVAGSNTITVSGETADDSQPNPAPHDATDDLKIYSAQIAVSTTKNLTNSSLWAIPGQSTTAQLEAKISDFPLTTHPATRVVIDDPKAVSGVDEWYEAFNATAITMAQIPNNATLTVQYRDADGAFINMPGMVKISGATNGIFSADIPANLRDSITGIRFVYESTEGFVPGQKLSPNITYTLRDTLRTTNGALPTGELTNTVGTQASNQDKRIASPRVEDDAPIVLNPATGNGGEGTGFGLNFDKSWDPEFVFSHSRMSTNVKLTWGTNGVQGLDRVRISDTATDSAGAPVGIAASAFNAFDLSAIGPISDPRMKFDRVQVELYNGTAWVSTSACGLAACSGASIPKITLTPAERASTQAVRFVITENKEAREASSSITDPLPNTGVATGEGRIIPLTFTLRDTLRAAPHNPVVAGPTYNSATPSVVVDDASLEAYVGADRRYRGVDSDSVTVVDSLLAVAATKEWSGGSIAIPAPDKPSPTTRVQLSATNNTVGGTVQGQNVPGLVSELRIVEPGALGTVESPFDLFDLVRFESLTAPAGTTEVRVRFTGAGAPADIVASTAQAALTDLNALNVGDLRNATGVAVVYSGAIQAGDANGKGTLAFDLELRRTKRSDNSAVTVPPAPVKNSVLGQVMDPRWDSVTGTFNNETLGAQDEKSMGLTSSTIGVTTAKSFSPSTQTEPATSPIAMSLSGTPTGTERAKYLTLTDDRATFWNSYDFVKISDQLRLPVFSPAGKPAQVELSVCTGRDFEAWDFADNPDATCVETGGTWSDYTAPMTQGQAHNWASSNPAAVQGIRIRISRVDLVQWENPQAPKVTIPVLVQRRATLQSNGEPVRSTLVDGGAVAPGESTKGVTTNTVRADLEGIWGGTANAAANATLAYAHARNAVQVQKDPIGVKQPGIPFDYTLKVTNTGARDVVDPVITDLLPWNSTLGTLVQFNPDAAAGTPRYTYALSGANSASGPAMPTDAAQVSVSETLDTATPTLRFAFPAGTVFGVGQSYVITFKMMFVPGVTEMLPIVNSFGITGDRVWDSCTAPAGRTATLSPDATDCSTTAKVTPQRLPSVRTIKSVKPLDAAGEPDYSHGFAAGQNCAPDAAGFVFQPCVPRTKPGQAEDWRLSVMNNGTTEFETLVVADLLPTPGDSTLIAGFDRNSAWTPTLTDLSPVLANPVAGRTLEIYGTLAAEDDICMAGVKNPKDLDGCISPTDPQLWMTLADITDKRAVTALLFVVSGTPILPGERIDLIFQTKTGAFSGVTPAQDPKAFNTLTVSALSRGTNGPAELMAARDQSNIGVALITGSVQISKQITGDAKAFVPADQVFAGELRCVSVGETVPARPFSLIVGETVTIDNLPYGAECEVFETAASEQTEYVVTPGSVTVGDGSDANYVAPKLNIVNKYDLTNLVVSKTVQSEAESLPTNFGFEVSCTFLGAELDLGADASFTLSNGESRTIDGLPVNAECEVVETDKRGADSVTIDASSEKSDGGTHGAVQIDEDEASASFENLAPASGKNVAAFTNNYGAIAELTVKKVLAGGAVILGESQTFTIDVSCVFEGETVFAGPVELNAGNGWTKHVRDLIAGTECTLTERALLGADAVTITPNDGVDATTGVVEIPADATDPVEVTVTNRYLAGSVEVTKLITGDGAEAYGTADFTTSLVCTLNDAPFDIPGGATRTVNAGEPVAIYDGLPNGAECLLTETARGGATESTLVQGDGEAVDANTGLAFQVHADAAVVGDEDQAQPSITLENRFDLAEVSIEKIVSSEAVDAAGELIEYGPFEVTLSCDFEGEEIAVADAVRSITAGETVTWTGLPAGADCLVTETDTADADSVEYLVEGADSVEGIELNFDSIAAIEAGENVATLVNSFDTTSLEILKVIDGDAAAKADKLTFEVELTCTLTDASRPDGEIVWQDTVELSKSNQWRAQIDNLARDAECVLEETETGEANATKIAVDDKVSKGAKVTFALDEAEKGVTVTNTFLADLPMTGGNLIGIGMLALLLLLGGGGALVVARRQGLRSE